MNDECINEWMNEQTNDRTIERMNEWTNEWMKDLIHTFVTGLSSISSWTSALEIIEQVFTRSTMGTWVRQTVIVVCKEQCYNWFQSDQLPFFTMKSPSKHSSKLYCLTQGIMVVWRRQNNESLLELALKTVQILEKMWNNFPWMTFTKAFIIWRNTRNKILEQNWTLFEHW